MNNKNNNLNKILKRKKINKTAYQITSYYSNIAKNKFKII